MYNSTTMKKFIPFILILVIFVACENDWFHEPGDGTGRGSRYYPYNTDTLIIDTLEPASYASLRTYFSEDWDNWELILNDSVNGRIRTVFSEDWDNWEFEIGEFDGNIRTNFSEDWDNWELTCNGYEISIYTDFSEDWD